MRPALVLLVLVLAGLASSVGAQTAVVAKRRPTVPVKPAPAPAPTNPAAGFVLPTTPARLSLAGALTGLRGPGDGGATCRSSCARSRYACEVQEASCATEWTTCLKSCGDPAGPSQSALLPR